MLALFTVRGTAYSYTEWCALGGKEAGFEGRTSSLPGYLKLLLDLAGAVKQNEAGAARWECPMQEAQAQRTGTLCHAGVHQGASGLPIERESTAGATPLAPLLDCLQVETMLTGKGP